MRFKDKLRLTIGFSAGAVIGVCFFDLLPESFSLGSKRYNFDEISMVAAIGFMLYMTLDRLALLHSSSKESQVINKGALGAGSLSLHSVLDGIAIGIAFQISNSLGVIIAIGVIVHDFSDGLNTVTNVLRNKGQNSLAFRWLVIDSIAPVFGVVSTFFFRLPEALFAMVLALFSGFFFYLGASDLLPESQREYPSLWTTCMTIVGAAVIYLAVKYS